MAKYKKTFSIAFISLILLLICINVDVQAQGYDIGVKVDDEFRWEITYLDSELFEKITGGKSNIEVGSQKRLVIKEVIETGIYWLINSYLWDFNVDWSTQGKFTAIQVYFSAANFKVTYKVFLPTPVEDYLADVAEQINSTDYQFEGSTILSIEKSVSTNKTYLKERNYNIKGILAEESWYEYFPGEPRGRLIVRIEETFFMISMGLTFIGFILIGVLSISFIMIIRKKYLYKVY